MNLHVFSYSVCTVVVVFLFMKYTHIVNENKQLQFFYDSCMNQIDGSWSPISQDLKSDHERFISEDYEQESIGHENSQRVDGKWCPFKPSQDTEYFVKYMGPISEDHRDSYVDVHAYAGTEYQDQSVTTYISSSRVNEFDSLTLDKPISHNEYKNVSNIFGSVLCTGSYQHERMCHFHNLCYNTQYGDFILFLNNESTLVNIPLNTSNILDLSSVGNHNLHHFSIIKLPSETYSQFQTKWINEPSLVFNRFKPDNIMHVMHDDILPLYHTLRQLKFYYGNKANFDIHLITLERWQDDTEFEFLYELFSSHNIISYESLKDMSELVCFSDVHVGLSKQTTWYQYGFYTPQGPLLNASVTSHNIYNTINFILSRIDTNCTLCALGPYLVLFSRKFTRRILNEKELSLSIAQQTGLRVMSVSLETHSLVDIINLVYKSNGVIGMHGSLLILAIFLQPGSILIELFPFGVNPSHYTPYRTLANIPGMNISYEAWVNVNMEKTVMHPDWAPELGGISHLENKEEIMNQKEVPTHYCCENASWLFHIHQDTIVDIDAISNLIKKALNKYSNSKPSNDYHHLQAGPVIRLSCSLTPNSVIIKWEEPWSVKYIPHHTIQYEIWLYNSDLGTTSSFILSNVTTCSLPITSRSDYVVSVSCHLNTVQGHFSQVVKCK